MYKFMNQYDVSIFENVSQEVKNKQEKIQFGMWDQTNRTTIQNDINNITAVDQCKGLKCLVLHGVQINTLDNCQILQHINELAITGCKNIKNFEFLKKCDKLEKFHLHDMPICNVNMVLYLKSLKQLYMNSNQQITDFNALSKCNNLINLQLCDTSISDLSPIVDLKNLNKLLITENKNLSNEYQNEYTLNSEEIYTLFVEWKRTQQYKSYITKYNQQINDKQEISTQSHFEHTKVQHCDDSKITVSNVQNQFENQNISLKIKNISNENFQQISQFAESLKVLKEQIKHECIHQSIDDLCISLQMLQNGNTDKLYQANQHFIQLLNSINNIK